MGTVDRIEFQHLSRELLLELLLAEIEITEKLSEEFEAFLSLGSIMHMITHPFPGGEIQVAILKMDGMVYHAYRYFRAHGSDQWFAPSKIDPAGAATKLAYGKGAKIDGRPKTAAEVWNDMLPYLVPIPQLPE